MKKIILSLIISAFAFASFGQKFLENSPPQSPTVERINQAMTGAYVASGTDTYTTTFANGSYSYTALTNLAISVTFTNTNTVASTLNFDGLGAKNIYKWSSGALTAVSAGDLIGTIRLRYDGTQFVMEGGTGSGGVGDVTYADLKTSRTLTSADDLDQSDQFKIVYVESATPFNVTVDALDIGTQVYVRNDGAATVTLIEGSGVTLVGTTIDIESGKTAVITYKTSTAPAVDVSGSGGGGTWGSITGTLSAQTDLQSALDAKQDDITFGTGVQTALGVNVGSAGSVVVNGGALGTPSSGTGTNITGIVGTNVTNTPAGTIAATNVQAALNELDTEKQPVLSGLTSGTIPVATSSSTIGNSGLRYKVSPTSSLFPATALVNIPGINGTLPPWEFLNFGYLGGDTVTFPNNHLIRAPRGFVVSSWSQNMVNNWVWDPIDARAEPFNTNIAMLGFEVGGEGILNHYTAPGSIPALSFHEISRAGGGVDGLTGIHPYTSVVPFNQFKAPIFMKWESATTPPVGTAEAWWGGTNNAVSSRINPELWLIREENKGTLGNDDYQQDVRLDGFGTFMNLNFARANGTYNSKTIMTTGQQVGQIGAIVYDGSTYQRNAAIDFATRGTPSAGNVPVSIFFKTSATNTAGLTNRVEISSTGNVGFGVIGSLTQTAKVHIAAGTTGAGTAPLKFESGSLMTTAEAGAVEFLTDKFYGTITTGAARKELTLNDAALTSGRVPYATTNGRIKDESGYEYNESTNTETVGTVAATTLVTTPSVVSTVTTQITNAIQVSGSTTRKTYEVLCLDAAAVSGDLTQSFLSGYTDATCSVIFTVTAVKSDGSESFGGEYAITYNKDGGTTVVQVGTTTNIYEHKTDAGASFTADVLSNQAHFSYDSGDIDSYRWTIWAKVTITQL